MLNLLKKKLVLIVKNRNINGYKNMSKDELINAINISKPANNNKKKTFKSKKRRDQSLLM